MPLTLLPLSRSLHPADAGAKPQLLVLQSASVAKSADGKLRPFRVRQDSDEIALSDKLRIAEVPQDGLHNPNPYRYGLPYEVLVHHVVIGGQFKAASDVYQLPEMQALHQSTFPPLTPVDCNMDDWGKRNLEQNGTTTKLVPLADTTYHLYREHLPASVFRGPMHNSASSKQFRYHTVDLYEFKYRGIAKHAVPITPEDVKNADFLDPSEMPIRVPGNSNIYRAKDVVAIIKHSTVGVYHLDSNSVIVRKHDDAGDGAPKTDRPLQYFNHAAKIDTATVKMDEKPVEMYSEDDTVLFAAGSALMNSAAGPLSRHSMSDGNMKRIEIFSKQPQDGTDEELSERHAGTPKDGHIADLVFGPLLGPPEHPLYDPEDEDETTRIQARASSLNALTPGFESVLWNVAETGVDQLVVHAPLGDTPATFSGSLESLRKTGLYGDYGSFRLPVCRAVSGENFYGIMNNLKRGSEPTRIIGKRMPETPI